MSTTPGTAWPRSTTALGNADRAAALREKARVLFDRFNDVFWDEDTGFYAYCLDGDKKKVLTVASNPGHCLWCRHRAAGTGAARRRPAAAAGHVERLGHPHTVGATTRPTIRIPIRTGRCGRTTTASSRSASSGTASPTEAARVARAISDAGSYFALYQMPELYAGIERDDANFPVQYLGANVPQAWAAGSVFSMLQALIGFEPDAPGGKLYIDPVAAGLAARPPSGRLSARQTSLSTCASGATARRPASRW